MRPPEPDQPDVDELRRHHVGVKTGSPAPPTPPPAPRSPWTDPPWKGKVLYYTWGLETGQFTPDTLAAFAQRCGVRAAAVQITPGNVALHPEVKAKLHAHGIAYVVWERSDQKPASAAVGELNALQPDGYLADVEGPLLDTSFAHAIANAFPLIPRALCATGALDQEAASPVAASAGWIGAGWDLCMQDYDATNPNATPAGDENWSFWRNWPLNAIGKRHYPVLEINAEGSKPFAAQLPDVDGYRDDKGRLCVGVYLAEELAEADVAAIAAA